MPCSKCSSILLIGIDGQEKYFCPICEGLKVMERKKSLSFVGNEISSRKKEIEKIFKKYDRKDIIGSLVATRELEPLSSKYSGPFNHIRFLGANLALRYALKFDNFGTDRLDSPFEDNFQKIIFYSKESIEFINIIYLISANYGVFIEVPEDKDPSKFVIDLKTTPYLMGETPSSIKQKISRQQFKFTERWKPILDNYKKFGFLTETEFYRERMKKRVNTKKSEPLNKRRKKQHRKEDNTPQYKTNRTYLKEILTNLYSLELGDLSRKQLKFSEFKDNFEYYIGLIKILSDWSLPSLDDTKYDPWGTKYATLHPFGLDELYLFFLIFAKPRDMPLFFKKIVSGEDNVKEFPLVVKLDENEFLIPPYTLKLIAYYLSFKHLPKEKEKINQLRVLEGYGFETVVSRKLSDIGVTVDYTNYMDNPKNPSLEIDIIAHYRKTIFVIDCKSWLLTSNYLFRKAHHRKEKELEEEAQKQEKRVKYVKTSMKLLGFDENCFKDIKSVIITRLNEEIEKVDNSLVIPFDKIEELLKV